MTHWGGAEPGSGKCACCGLEIQVVLRKTSMNKAIIHWENSNAMELPNWTTLYIYVFQCRFQVQVQVQFIYTYSRINLQQEKKKGKKISKG